jgi:hypothetical protein
MTQVFGSGGINDQLGRLSLIPSLTGEQVKKFAGPASSLAATTSWGLGPMELADPHFVRCFLTGTLKSDAQFSEPVRIAVAVDGVVAVTTRTSLAFQGGKTWTALIPTGLLGETDPKITVYEIRGAEDQYSLHQIGEAF